LQFNLGRIVVDIRKIGPDLAQVPVGLGVVPADAELIRISRESIMRKRMTCVGIELAVILATPPRTSLAQNSAPATRPTDEIIYQPPSRSLPDVRIEPPGSRGLGNDLPTLYILAPNQVGYTTYAGPRVFWYLSRPTNAPLVLTVKPDDPTSKIPPFKTVLDATKSGIQCLDLAKCNVQLQSGLDYQVSLALKPDKDPRAKDILCSAEIMYVTPPSSLFAQLLATTDPVKKTRLLARNSMFYDAMWELTHQIEVDPRDKSWHELRASLLDQIGLGEVADFDRTSAQTHSASEP
jgi:hypothetical protein